MSWRTDEPDELFDHGPMRAVFEQNRIKYQVDRLNSSMTLIKRSVLGAVILSFILGLFAWASLGEPEEMVRHQMMPVGMAFAASAAGLFAYSIWARSAWRIKRDQIEHLLYDHGANYYEGSRNLRGLRLMGPLGGFTVILLFIKLLVVHRVTAAVTGAEPQSAGSVAIAVAVLVALWGVAVLIDRFSDSLPY